MTATGPLPLRSGEDRLLWGVCGGLAAAAGIDAALVRLAFVAAFLLGGFGLLVYAAFAFLLPGDPVVEAPGRRAARAQELAGLAAIAVAGLFAMASTGVIIAPGALGALALLVLGAAVLIRRGLARPRELPWRGGREIARLGAGAMLIAGGVAVLALGASDLRTVPVAATSAVVLAAGVGLLLGPRVQRARAEAARERAERVRADERAQVAARLHDSVLQTLALVQHSDDLVAAQRLARAQERELRAWLSGGQAPGAPATLGGALRSAAADVERRYAIAVDLVQTRDAGLDDRLADLAAAAREAMVNAAKHSGASRVAVYVRLTAAAATVFVRDEGRGFDPGAVAAERRGLRDSVTRRLAVHGGTAQIGTEPGHGTEVELTIPLGAAT